MTAYERRMKVKELYDSGMSFREVGKKMGFTGQRASQLYNYATQPDRVNSELYQFYLHPDNADVRRKVCARTMETLRRHKIDTFEKLNELKISQVVKFMQVGAKTLEQIEWLKERVSEL